MDHPEIFLLIVFLEIVEMCTFFSQEVKIIRFSDLTNLRIHENDFFVEHHRSEKDYLRVY